MKGVVEEVERNERIRIRYKDMEGNEKNEE